MKGHCTWLIPDCYWPAGGTDAPYISHESVCVLNTSDEDAHISFTLYFEDREPAYGFESFCGARRSHHIRFDAIRSKDGASVPRGIPYAIEMKSSAPVWVQYSRCDTTQPSMAFMTAIPVHL